jgi:hypothetical protein
MSTPKRQHYVPRAYLAHFTDPGTPHGQEPYIWVYDRDEIRPYARAPHKLAVRTHYYSILADSGEWDTTVETMLAEVEGRAIPNIRKLIGGDPPESLPPDDREWLAYFIGLLSVRIPAFRDTVESFVADIGRRIGLLGAQHPDYFARTMRKVYEAKGEKPPDAEQIESIRQFVLSGEYDIKTNPVLSLQTLIQMAPVAAQYVHAYRWRVLRAPADTPFITSDHPVVLVSTRKLPPPFGWSAGWETPWMEATIPLSPATCLLVSLHHPEGVEEVDSSTVAEVNLRTASYAAEAVYSSRRIDVEILNKPSNWDWWHPVSEALVPPQGSTEE